MTNKAATKPSKIKARLRQDLPKTGGRLANAS